MERRYSTRRPCQQPFKYSANMHSICSSSRPRPPRLVFPLQQTHQPQLKIRFLSHTCRIHLTVIALSFQLGGTVGVRWPYCEMDLMQRGGEEHGGGIWMMARTLWGMNRVPKGYSEHSFLTRVSRYVSSCPCLDEQ